MDSGQRKFGIRFATSSSPYAAVAACQMGLAPHLTGASPPTHRFRLYNLEAGDFLDRLKFLTNTFEGDWQGAWENIKKAFNDIWGLLPDEITTPIENAAKGLTEFITVHAENFGATWGVMKSKFETIWNLMPEAIKKPIEDASNGIAKFVLDISTGNWKTAWESMKNVFKGIWEKMPDAVKGPVNTIIGFANAMLSAIEGGVNGAISALNNLRACLKIHSRHLHAPLRGIFAPNSLNVAHYAQFIWGKSPTNCDAHLTKSNF